MCDCLGRTNIEIEELPPRYYGGPAVRRVSVVRDVDRDRADTYRRNVSRPRSSTASMRQIEYRPANSAKQKEGRPRETTSQYKAPPKIDYPSSGRFVPLPPLLPKEKEPAKVQEPKKGILRGEKKTKYTTQPSMVVYSPKRGRRERKYYYEDSEESDGDSWAGRSVRTEWTDVSADSWAIRPVKKYPDTKDGRRNRSRRRYYR